MSSNLPLRVVGIFLDRLVDESLVPVLAHQDYLHAFVPERVVGPLRDRLLALLMPTHILYASSVHWKHHHKIPAQIDMLEYD